MSRRAVAAVLLFAAMPLLLSVSGAACSGESAKWVGRYEIDRDALWKAWEADIAQKEPDRLEAMRNAVSTMRFDLDVEKDGTFKTGSIMSNEGLPADTETSIDSSGTWKAIGETITLTITRTRGQTVEGSISGTYQDGYLRLTVGPGPPILLRKRGGR